MRVENFYLLLQQALERDVQLAGGDIWVRCIQKGAHEHDSRRRWVHGPAAARAKRTGSRKYKTRWSMMC